MPWNLKPSERELFSRRNRQTGRTLIQPPTPDMKALDAGRDRVGGIEIGVLLVLAKLDELAEQGNRVAARLALKVRRDHGIAVPEVFAPGMSRAEGRKKPLLAIHEVPDGES